MIPVKNSLAAVERFPVQSIQAGAVVKRAVISFRHMNKKVSLKFGLFARLTLAWQVGHLRLD
jgi:hypothetical protein